MKLHRPFARSLLLATSPQGYEFINNGYPVGDNMLSGVRRRRLFLDLKLFA